MINIIDVIHLLASWEVVTASLLQMLKQRSLAEAEVTKGQRRGSAQVVQLHIQHPLRSQTPLLTENLRLQLSQTHTTEGEPIIACGQMVMTLYTKQTYLGRYLADDKKCKHDPH